MEQNRLDRERQSNVGSSSCGSLFAREWPSRRQCRYASLLSKSRENAYRIGLVMHVTDSIGFVAVYALLLVTLGFTKLPLALMLGLGVGVRHGLAVSLMRV